ncbi:unnamed protein product [Mucor circinelloides]|uniref:Post-GPI attachment to proteins factor 3 n=1 Tax=Mucor circinelloides f. circinelloides (strain 1006PhL) TaxID=1220926 RepID=S2JL11_MUCC1|nr:hypothetical protein HMPREF1544_02095 [Mucor circinelloides 1006PhL]KAG1120007.1 hypothetical protein G6F42_012847 [Rhizopus arrhizus]
MSKHAFLLAFIFCVIAFVQASIGDEQPLFNHCVDECVQVSCPAPLSFSLRLLKWSCPEDCRYVCMQAVTDKAIEEGLPVYQYYGKWPFYRCFGIQEPASVIFSIGNGLVHAFYFRQIQKQVPSGYFLKGFMLLYTTIGVNAWLWSTIFHSRDTKFTELMDYLSAGLLVLYSLYYAILRVYRLTNSLLVQTLGILFICLFVTHVGYLIIVTFDYVYNMYANVIVGGCQIAVWVGWFLVQTVQQTPARSYAHLAVISGVGVSLAMCLELFDFPPLFRVFDAHSLWHLSTIPLSIVWYKFLLQDTKHETNTKSYTAVKLLPA